MADEILELALTDQQVSQAFLLDLGEGTVEGGPAEVAVDEQDLAAGLGTGHGQVDGDGGLALLGTGTGNQHGPLAVRGQQNKRLVRVRRKHSETMDRGARRVASSMLSMRTSSSSSSGTMPSTGMVA